MHTRYRTQLNLPTILLAAGGIGVFFACLVLNLVRLRSWKELTNLNCFLCIFVILFSLFAVVFLTLVLCASCYVVKKRALYWRLGLFSYKILLSEITEVVYREKSKRLIVYYGEKNLMDVRIRPQFFSRFVDDLKDGGGEFTYSIDYEDLEGV